MTTRDEIIKMAREAGISVPWDQEPVRWDLLERFFHMAQAAEREACAKACEDMEEKAETEVTDCCKWPTPVDCAFIIRSRGKND